MHPFDTGLSVKSCVGLRQRGSFYDAAYVTENLSNWSGTLPKPPKESIAAELTKLDPEQQAEAWRLFSRG